MGANGLRMGKNKANLVGVIQAPSVAIFNWKWRVASFNLSGPCTPRLSIGVSCVVMLNLSVMLDHAEGFGSSVKI